MGDVITTKANFARNHLLLPKYAIYATPENLKKCTELIQVCWLEKCIFGNIMMCLKSVLFCSKERVMLSSIVQNSLHG